MAKLKWISRSAQFVQGNSGAMMYERYLGTDGQILMSTIMAFNPTSHDLHVHRNGVYQEVDVDYLELDGHTIQFLRPLTENESVLFTVQGVYTQRLHEEYVAVEGQTHFDLNGIYHPEQSMLLVFRNGVLQRRNSDYLETSDRAVTLTRACKENEVLIFHEQI